MSSTRSITSTGSGSRGMTTRSKARRVLTQRINRKDDDNDDVKTTTIKSKVTQRTPTGSRLKKIFRKKKDNNKDNADTKAAAKGVTRNSTITHGQQDWNDASRCGSYFMAVVGPTGSVMGIYNNPMQNKRYIIPLQGVTSDDDTKALLDEQIHDLIANFDKFEHVNPKSIDENDLMDFITKKQF